MSKMNFVKLFKSRLHQHYLNQLKMNCDWQLKHIQQGIILLENSPHIYVRDCFNFYSKYTFATTNLNQNCVNSQQFPHYLAACSRISIFTRTPLVLLRICISRVKKCAYILRKKTRQQNVVFDSSLHCSLYGQ